MDNGRVACRACFRSIVVDNDDVAPIWQLVLDFFEQMGIPTDAMKGLPVLLVGSDALAKQWYEQGSIHAASSCLTTSGLCLEDRSHTTPRSALDPEAPISCGESGVVGIICLTGLPKDLAGAVLAHEATHAWLRMHPRYPKSDHIPHSVEEGIAQLMSSLFLSDGLPPANTHTSPDGPSDEKLRQFFKYTIEREKSEVFGTGYRKAAVAYSEIGIVALLTHVLECRDFP